MSQEYAKVDPFLHTPDPAGAGAAQASVTTLEPAATSLGGSLRELREARGWSISDVSSRLKFNVRQIEALESERWAELPQGLSLRGLIRNYARLLEIDPDTLLHALPAHLLPANVATANLGAASVAMQPTPLQRWPGGGARRGRSWLVGILVFLLISVLALVAYLVFAWWLPKASEGSGFEPIRLPFSSESGEVLPFESVVPPQAAVPTVSTLPPGPSASGTVGREAPAGAEHAGTPASGPASAPLAANGAAVPGSAPGSAPVGSPVATGAAMPGATAGATVAGSPEGSSGALVGASAGGTPATLQGATEAVPAVQPLNQITFTVSAASWVEVRDADGGVVLSSTLQPGSETQVDVNPPARVVIGNANGVRLLWQGADVDLAAHQRGNVARLTLE